jgi:hypothetical protein
MLDVSTEVPQSEHLSVSSDLAKPDLDASQTPSCCCSGAAGVVWPQPVAPIPGSLCSAVQSDIDTV